MKANQQMSEETMETKDIYDIQYMPSVLLTPGSSLTKFKKYFHESHYQRKPKIDFFLDQSSRQWLSKCHIIEPKEAIFNAKASTKKNSESIVMAKALMWLRDNNFVDNSFNAIYTSDQQIQDFLRQTNAPIVVKQIDDSLVKDMKSFCDNFEQKWMNRLHEICRNHRKKSTEEFDENNGQKSIDPKKKVIRNIFSNKEYEEPNDETIIDREIELNLFINDRQKREEMDPSFRSLRQKVSELPIHRLREHILETIDKNRVVVIAGDTGCGKTTQIPQMIFNNEISEQRGAQTNIVVTEPRRLSAIAVSERIALEFGEEVIGESIGYNVRFNKCLPKHSNGLIMLCSAGILLRKLGNNPTLKGVSHVIVDEVHERDVIIDFLLVLLKRALNSNPKLKVILMSASMNANLFVQYFKCPLIEIPGRCHEVKHFYLNDFSQHIRRTSLQKSFWAINPKIDENLIIDLIRYIDGNRGDGAILCFLPGWADIQLIANGLEKINESNNLMVVPVHSRLPHSQQKQIFAKTPVGVRKVVLATNIAETSLTIEDVVYVIDSGLAKEMKYNSKLNISSFGTHWISRANAKQRSGRAGRVRKGECYRIYTQDVENAYMDEFPIPEMLRIPLENVVMQAKLHCPDEPVADFLSAVPQPPTNSAIVNAIKILKEIKILDENECLTALGDRIVNFSTHPRLSVALVYSSFLSCLRSVLPLVSHLSANREPFQVLSEEKHLIREVKNNYSFNIMSDHIPLVHLTIEYMSLYEGNRSSEMYSFCAQNYLHRYSMDNSIEAMKLFASHMEESELISKDSWKYPKSDVNFNWHRKSLIASALVPAFTPNFVRLMRGEIKNRKIKSNAIYPMEVRTGAKVKFVSESVLNQNFNSSPQLDKISNSVVVYFGSFFSENSRLLTICDGTVISPFAILLFSDHKFEFNFDSEVVRSISDNECVVVLRDNKYLQFRLKRSDAQLLNRWNIILDLFFQWFLIKQQLKESDIEENDEIVYELQDFLQFTNQLIDEQN